MKNPELYHKTVDILYQAYFNDTLSHHDCYNCAVGNICKEAANQLNIEPRSWANTFVTITDREDWSAKQLFAGDGQIITQNLLFGHFIKRVDPDNESDMRCLRESRMLLERVPYPVRELARIENAFERAPFGESGEDYMFNGLVAVLEVLREIHEVTNEDLLTANNKRFSDHYKSKTTV
jgi:hypothetical protein